MDRGLVGMGRGRVGMGRTWVGMDPLAPLSGTACAHTRVGVDDRLVMISTLCMISTPRKWGRRGYVTRGYEHVSFFQKH